MRFNGLGNGDNIVNKLMMFYTCSSASWPFYKVFSYIQNEQSSNFHQTTNNWISLIFKNIPISCTKPRFIFDMKYQPNVFFVNDP